MATHEKDVEAGTPIYVPKSSPKFDDLQGDRPVVEGASLPWLLLASMPRMAVQMAWTAQTIAVGPVGMGPTTVKLIQVSGPIYKWGRRRPFLLFGALLSAVLLFATCCADYIGQTLDASGTATSIVTVFFYVCMTASICAVEIPATLLVVDLAGDRQVTGAALCQGWSFLGAVITMLYIKLFGDITSFGSFVAVLTVLMLLVIVVVVFTVKETPHEPLESSPDPVRGVLSTVFGDLHPLSSTLLVYSSIIVLMQYGMATYNGSRVMFFESVGENKSDNDYYDRFGGDSVLGDVDFFLGQLSAAYIFTWTLPFLTNKFGAQRILTASLVPVALLTIMSFFQSKTLVGLIDFVQAIFRTTLFVFIVPVIVHVYGTTKDLGARVGVYYCIGNLGQLMVVIVGNAVVTTGLAYQLPVILGGVMAIICIVISVFALKLNLKSL